MLSIILFLLKLIGIILAFIVLVILLIIIVPIRYDIYAEAENDIYVRGNVSYFLRIVRLKSEFKDKKLKTRISILGYELYDSDKIEERERKRQEKKIKNKAKTDKKKAKEKAKAKKKRQKKKSKKNQETSKKQRNVKNQDSKVKDSKKQDKKNKDLEYQHSKNDDSKNQGIINQEFKNADFTNKNQQKDSSKIEKKVVELSTNEYKLTDTMNEGNDILSIPGPTTKNQENDSNNNNFIERMKLIIIKILGIIKKVVLKGYKIVDKIKSFVKTVKDKYKNIAIKILNIKEKLNRLKEIIEKIKVFLKDDINKDSLKNLFGHLKRIGKHIAPKKIKGEVEFGRSDPYDTGKILAILSMGYSFFGKKVKIYPNFEEEILRGNLRLQGRIRLGTLLVIGIRIILYKNNRQLLKNIMVLKEEL